jgi:hypothetical protein
MEQVGNRRAARGVEGAGLIAGNSRVTAGSGTTAETAASTPGLTKPSVPAPTTAAIPKTAETPIATARGRDKEKEDIAFRLSRVS